MNDITRDALKDMPELLKKYEKREAKYILDLGEDYETIDVELRLSYGEFADFIIKLAELNMCFDEWADFVLKQEVLRIKSRENTPS